jgi:hypothetical protein
LPPDIIDASQLALQRLEAIHPARDNARLVDELEKNLRTAVNGAFVKVTTYRIGWTPDEALRPIREP